ncbi:MAG TPA: hypothetical protein P5347_04885 [Smithellaceae bacterium]|nr:hypothetical protein [Smithellaceae bacterium]
MTQEMIILLSTAAFLGFFHTLLGPDHYLPFIFTGKAGQWSMAKKAWITVTAISSQGSRRSLRFSDFAISGKRTDMKQFHAIILSLLIIPLLAAPVMGSDDWKEFYTGRMGNVASYKKGTSEESREKYVIIVKEVFSDQGRESYIQDRIKKNLSTEGYEKLSNIQSTSEMDCAKERILNKSVFSFDVDGKLLNCHFAIELKWMKMPDNPFFNALRKEVCERPLIK